MPPCGSGLYDDLSALLQNNSLNQTSLLRDLKNSLTPSELGNADRNFQLLFVDCINLRVSSVLAAVDSNFE